MKDNDRDFDTTDDTALATLFVALQPISPPAQIEAALLARVHTHGAELVTVRADQGEWQSVAPGVRLKILTTDTAAHMRSFLIEMEPGTSMPAHGHINPEECFVLSGEVALGDVVIRAGDHHLAPSGVPHGVVHTQVGVVMFVRGDLPEAATRHNGARHA